MNTPLAMMTCPSAMAARAWKMARALEDAGDRAGADRAIERVSAFMALPGYDYDQFRALGGLG